MTVILILIILILTARLRRQLFDRLNAQKSLLTMVASESILLDGRAAQTRPSKNLPTMVEFDPILHCEVSIDKTNLKKCKHTVNLDKAILYRHQKSTGYYKRCVLSFNMFIRMTCPKKCSLRPFTIGLILKMLILTRLRREVENMNSTCACVKRLKWGDILTI